MYEEKTCDKRMMTAGQVTDYLDVENILNVTVSETSRLT